METGVGSERWSDSKVPMAQILERVISESICDLPGYRLHLSSREGEGTTFSILFGARIEVGSS